MTTQSAATGLARDLSAIVGVEHVADDPAALASFTIDGATPRIAISPGTAEEVAAVLQVCHARELVVVPAGGMSGQRIGRPPARIDVLLRTHRLNFIEHYDPGDLTIGLGAGVTLAQAYAMLTPNRQVLPLTTARPELSTLGGVLARAAHDPRKQGFGGLRDYCIGIRFVTADGKVARGGGRVVKNVAGFDLMKLMIGSFGTLGVIVSASLKVFPQPRQTRTFAAEFDTLERAIAFRDRLLRSVLSPMCLELLSPRAVTLVAPENLRPRWTALIRAAGSDAVLARYERELGPEVYAACDEEAEESLWRSLCGFTETALARNPNAVTLRLSLPPATVQPAVDLCLRAAQAHGLDAALVASAGVGSICVAFLPEKDPPPAAQIAALVGTIRHELPRDASVVMECCSVEVKREIDVWGASPTDLQCMREVKRALDEKDILNRGRFLF